MLLFSSYYIFLLRLRLLCQHPDQELSFHSGKHKETQQKPPVTQRLLRDPWNKVQLFLPWREEKQEKVDRLLLKISAFVPCWWECVSGRRSCSQPAPGRGNQPAADGNSQVWSAARLENPPWRRWAGGGNLRLSDSTDPTTAAPDSLNKCVSLVSCWVGDTL